MGIVKAKIESSNPRNRKLKGMAVDALVDSGAPHLCIPEHVAMQLALEAIYKREVTTANGKKRLGSYAGPIEVKFENRSCFTGALVLGGEVLFGAVSMEDMNVLLSPVRQALIVNPDSPNIATSIAKGIYRLSES